MVRRMGESDSSSFMLGGIVRRDDRQCRLGERSARQGWAAWAGIRPTSRSSERALRACGKPSACHLSRAAARAKRVALGLAFAQRAPRWAARQGYTNED